jgi:hypothetical protein
MDASVQGAPVGVEHEPERAPAHDEGQGQAEQGDGMWSVHWYQGTTHPASGPGP